MAEKPSAIEAAIDVVATFGGVVFGFCGGYYLNELLPVAANLTEKVIRGAAVGLGGTVAGTAGKRLLQAEMLETHEAVLMAQMEAKGLLTSEEVAEVTETAKKK